MSPQESQKKIGRYLVEKELGRGGMGVVYLAQDPFIDRRVAIKVTQSPPADPKGLEEFQKVFFNEARTAGKLTHPHIVSVYDAAMEGGLCYLVMEYVDGPTLKEHCRRDNLLSRQDVVEIIFQCAKALDYAHRNGVIHRDIKPSNIMISADGNVKITDFGIATAVGASEAPRADGVAGSVHYMAPEQLRNEPRTPQSDLFSLGVVMYELLTGAKPFEASTDYAVFFKIANEAPEPLENYRKDISEPLEQIVMKAIEKDLAKRYQSCGEMAADLSASFDRLRSKDEKITFEEKCNALKRIEFFRDFTSNELAEILNSTQWFRYKARATIITEGDIEDCFYIIVAGEVVVKKQDKALATRKQGDCFGEMAYRGKTKRTATVEAVTDSVLIRIKASVIDNASVNTQLRFHKEFARTLIQRLTYTSNLLLQEPAGA